MTILVVTAASLFVGSLLLWSFVRVGARQMPPLAKKDRFRRWSVHRNLHRARSSSGEANMEDLFSIIDL